MYIAPSGPPVLAPEYYEADQTKPKTDQLYKFTFEKIDADGDGQITKTEWNNFIDNNPNLSDSQKQTLKDSFDMYAKNDGYISRDDFKQQEGNIEAILDPKYYLLTEKNPQNRHSAEDAHLLT